MDKNKSNTPRYTDTQINWNEMAGIGISREKLETSGQLEPFMRGERTEPLRLNLVLLGAPIDMDATLRIVDGDNGPLLEIEGVKPD